MGFRSFVRVITSTGRPTTIRAEVSNVRDRATSSLQHQMLLPDGSLRKLALATCFSRTSSQFCPMPLHAMSLGMLSACNLEMGHRVWEQRSLWLFDIRITNDVPWIDCVASLLSTSCLYTRSSEFPGQSNTTTLTLTTLNFISLQRGKDEYPDFNNTEEWSKFKVFPVIKHQKEI